MLLGIILFSLFVYIQIFSSYSFVVVLSDSNSPSQFTGDVVLIDEKINPKDIKIKDVLIYENPNYGITIIHRVFDIWISDDNEVYLAMKGDSNDQPDISDQLETTIINRNISYSLTNRDFSSPVSVEILVSYYKATDVLVGKVLYRIPMIGWTILVPFFSPLSLLLIIYLVITIILLFSNIFRILNSANKKFKKILQSISINNQVTYSDKKINNPNYYSFFIIPIILFINLFMFSGIQANYSVQVDLIENTLDFDFTNSGYVKWNETISLVGGIKSYTNISIITIFVEDVSQDGFIDLKFVELVSSKGEIVEDQIFGNSKPFNEISDYNYDVKLKNSTLEILEVQGNSNPSRDLLGHHAFFINIIPKLNNNTNQGYFVRDFYRFAEETTHNSEKAWKTFNEFNGIQELTQFTVIEESLIANNGILLNYSFEQSESLILIPELLFSIIPILIFLPTVKYFHKRVEKEFLKKLSVLLDENSRIEDNPEIDKENIDG